MAAMDFFADDLAQAKLVDVETLWQAEFDIEKSVVDALDADANGPTVGFGSGLRVAGHGNDFGFFRGKLFGLSGSVLGHRVVPGVARFGDACAGASMSSSVNCRLCRRA